MVNQETASFGSAMPISFVVPHRVYRSRVVMGRESTGCVTVNLEAPYSAWRAFWYRTLLGWTLIPVENE